jgi:ATP-dependent Clp protease protease subunit
MSRTPPAGEGEKLLADLTELFHERGVNFPTRTLYLGPDVSDESAEQFLKNLHVLEQMAADPVTVLVNNCGGDDYNGLAIFDAIKQCRSEITMVVRGSAMSMGSVILQAAGRRIMGPLATQMIHMGSCGVEAHANTFQKIAAEARRVNAWMESMYLSRIREKHPKFPLARLKRMLNHDTYMTAERSIELGLADEIG